MLTAERLREVLSYDPETGAFRWLSNCRSRSAGDAAGRVGYCGYIELDVDGKTHRCHRLAWLYVHGEWPLDGVDHINGIKSDNRLANLRSATQKVNAENKRVPYSNNKSKLLGVSLQRGRWVAYLCQNYKSKWVGSFATPELAHEAYVRAKRQLHPGCTL